MKARKERNRHSSKLVYSVVKMVTSPGGYHLKNQTPYFFSLQLLLMYPNKATEN